MENNYFCIDCGGKQPHTIEQTEDFKGNNYLGVFCIDCGHEIYPTEEILNALKVEHFKALNVVHAKYCLVCGLSFCVHIRFKSRV